MMEKSSIIVWLYDYKYIYIYWIFDTRNLETLAVAFSIIQSSFWGRGRMCLMDWDHRRSGAPRSTQSWSPTLSHSEALWGFKIKDPDSMHE